METILVPKTSHHPVLYSFKVHERRRAYSSKSKTMHRILVVEDDHLSAKILVLMLGDLKCDVDIATNGEKALELFKQNSYDLVFMDIGLPGMDGYTVTRRLRTMEKDGKRHVPIIALSAHVESDRKLECLNAGMDEVLTKPLFRAKAVEILNTFLGDSSNH